MFQFVTTYRENIVCNVFHREEILTVCNNFIGKKCYSLSNFHRKTYLQCVKLCQREEITL